MVAALAILCIQQLVLEEYVLNIRAKRFNQFYRISSRPFIVKAYRGRAEGFGISANVLQKPQPLNMPGNEETAPPAPPFAPERFQHMLYLLTIRDALSSGIVILLLSGVIKLGHSLFISEKQKKLLENERLNAELNFLKLQINPHFLFNTLNSIYSQAHFKSEQTEYSILKFSRIMRYVLYESAVEKIALSQDLEYISNYIDLQLLRLSKNITVQYNVTGPVAGLSIAPLLLITFIENAFKHGISYTTPSEIKIAIAVTGKELSLTVENAVTQLNRGSAGGVGLINARRRLDVLYPGRHLLDVVTTDHLYIVKLKIELDHES
jgi:LytS/YehU family sensor histidine kinase